MEKCTFCVQRIREAENRAKSEGRALRDGEVAPACVQTCPAGALSFGDYHLPDGVMATRAGPARLPATRLPSQYPAGGRLPQTGAGMDG